MNFLDEAFKFGIGFAGAFTLTYFGEKSPLRTKNPLAASAAISGFPAVYELANYKLMGEIPEPSFLAGITAGTFARSLPSYLKMRAKEKAVTVKDYFLGDIAETEY